MNFNLTGYVDILLIPEGATNIVVKEVEPSNNYLGNVQFIVFLSFYY